MNNQTHDAGARRTSDYYLRDPNQGRGQLAGEVWEFPRPSIWPRLMLMLIEGAAVALFVVTVCVGLILFTGK